MNEADESISDTLDDAFAEAALKDETISQANKRIKIGLQNARKEILKLSDQIADDDLSIAELQDKFDEARSDAFVEAATATDEKTNKLVNPNLDAQRAAVVVALKKNDDYKNDLKDHRELLKARQKKKNRVICEHEKRGDLKTELDMRNKE